MFKDILQNFPKQLDYEPVIENADNFFKKNKFVVCGMGGSNLATDIIKSWKPELDAIVHRNYGLPLLDDVELKNRLIIISSCSGNTEETISAFEEAFSRNLSVLIIAAGGKLLELAKEKQVSYIQLPSQAENPRFIIGLSIKATLKAMGEELILKNVNSASFFPNSNTHELVGKEMAQKLENKIPLIYSSYRNRGLAYFWKIHFNETVKIPAFCNSWPELNHNEMAGFGYGDGKHELGSNFIFIFLNDRADDPMIKKRISVTREVLEKNGYAVLDVDVAESTLPWHTALDIMLTATWTSYYLAQHYGVDSEDVSMIEDFKRSLAS